MKEHTCAITGFTANCLVSSKSSTKITASKNTALLVWGFTNPVCHETDRRCWKDHNGDRMTGFPFLLHQFWSWGCSAILTLLPNNTSFHLWVLLSYPKPFMFHFPNYIHFGFCPDILSKSFVFNHCFYDAMKNSKIDM